jgi:hypothetical protein
MRPAGLIAVGSMAGRCLAILYVAPAPSRWHGVVDGTIPLPCGCEQVLEKFKSRQLVAFAAIDLIELYELVGSTGLEL